MKKCFKKTLALMLSLIMLMSVMPMTNVFAADIVASGSCEDIDWSLTLDGTLTISGEGEICRQFSGSYLQNYTGAVKTVIIEEGITGIQEYAFADCHNITDMTIPESLKRIEWDGINYSAAKQMTVHYNGSESSWASIYVDDYDVRLALGSSGLIFAKESLPEDIIDSGECGDDLTWSLTFDGTLTISGEGEMWNYDWNNISPWARYFKYIKNAIVEEGVTSIGSMAFQSTVDIYGIYNLKRVILPESLISICKFAFSGCNLLEDITIPGNVTSIGECAFIGCMSIDNITIPDGVTVIERNTFEECESLKTITIHENIERIGSLAFSGCQSLSDIYFEGNECEIFLSENVLPIKTIVHCNHNSTAHEYAKIYSRKVIFSDDHTFEAEFTMPSTCTSYGFRALKCKYCEYKTNEVLNPSSHVDNNDDGICDICFAQQGGTGSGHEHEYTATVIDPTCKTEGSVTLVCSDCEYTKVIPVAINTNSHIYGDWSYTATATCVTEGEISHTCTLCGTVETQTVSINITNHTGKTEVVNAKTPTCTVSGYSGDVYCADCHFLIAEGKELECSPHTIVKDEAIPATCVSSGLTEGEHCSVCKTVIIEQTVTKATGHNDSDGDGVCNSCGENIGQQQQEKGFIDKLSDFIKMIIDFIKKLFK